MIMDDPLQLAGLALVAVAILPAAVGYAVACWIRG